MRNRLNAHIDRLVSNLRSIIAVNRNLNFFTTGYNYLIQLIPVLIVAPLFIDHKVDFGVIGQSEFLLQIFGGRGCAKATHSDDAAKLPHVAFPTENRGFFNSQTRRNRRR